MPTNVPSDSSVFGVEIIGSLAPAPMDVLLLGEQTSEVTEQLEGLGYGVSAFRLCDPNAMAQQASRTRQANFEVNIPLGQVNAPSFDVALVLGFSSVVHPLSLFDQLSRYISMNGVVLLLGSELEVQRPRVARWLDYVVAIATRCGFLPLELGNDSTLGSQGTYVRAFRKCVAPRWQLRHMRFGDYAEIAVLFQEVFGHPLSPELWEWKYMNGHGNAVLASRDGVLIAHYGGIYREILLCGKPEWAYGGSDVMVHPKERGVMTRQGPFLLTAATTAEMYGPVAFGFPTERAMLVAERMGLYSKAGQMREVRWGPETTGFRWRSRLHILTRGNAADQEMVDGLWRAMANDLHEGVVGVRDWQYLEQRFFAHPHNHYDVLMVISRLNGRPLGVMVLRRLENTCELLDVIAPLANLDVTVDQARRMTARWELAYLYCWITSNYAHLFTACAGKEEALNVFIPTSCWTDDPRVDMLKDRWWLTSGDTDFR
jgi:hypothetical protein